VHVLAVRRHAAGRVEPQARRARDRRVRARVVGHHEHVVVRAVLEEVEDAVLLHQTADEREVGLAILDAIIPRRVLLEQLEAEARARQAGRGEHRPQDVGRALLLEHAAILAMKQAPDPRDQLDRVELVALALAHVLGGRDHAGDVAWGLDAFNLEDRGFIDEVSDVEPSAGELDVELERIRQALATGESDDPELAAAGLEREDRPISEERVERRHQAHSIMS
jgi:hypothetical protein